MLIYLVRSAFAAEADAAATPSSGKRHNSLLKCPANEGLGISLICIEYNLSNFSLSKLYTPDEMHPVQDLCKWKQFPSVEQTYLCSSKGFLKCCGEGVILNGPGKVARRHVILTSVLLLSQHRQYCSSLRVLLCPLLEAIWFNEAPPACC